MNRQRTQAALEQMQQTLKRINDEINTLSDMLIHDSARLNAQLAADEEMHNEPAPHGLHAIEEEALEHFRLAGAVCSGFDGGKNEPG